MRSNFGCRVCFPPPPTATPGRGGHGSRFDPRRLGCGVPARAGGAIWTRTAIADVEVERVADALRGGMSIRETADSLGLNKSKVERLKAKAKEKGLLDG
jgi:hypothetical protein